MKPENYLNVVEKLNNDLEQKDEYDYFIKEGICFEYCSTGYTDAILFMDFVVFYSEMDEVYSEEHLENMIKQRMLEYTNALCRWQHFDGF